MADAGAAVVLEDSELDSAHLTTLAADILGDADRLERMSAASASLARPDAALVIADEILATTGR